MYGKPVDMQLSITINNNNNSNTAYSLYQNNIDIYKQLLCEQLIIFKKNTNSGPFLYSAFGNNSTNSNKKKEPLAWYIYMSVCIYIYMCVYV